MLIPIQCEYYALEGLSQLLHTIEQIREHLNPRLKVGAIMLTMYDARTRLAAGVADEVREHFGDRGAQNRHPPLGPDLRGSELRPDRADLRPGSAGALSYLEASAELAHQITDQQEAQAARPEESR